MEPGTFVQVNKDSCKANIWPIGYVVRENGCWDWVGSKTARGYGCWSGAVRMGLSRSAYAHRVMYEMHVGSISKGLTIDHLCRNHSCVNPAHLEPVTQRENVLRGLAPAALVYQKEHCWQGHPLLSPNDYYTRKREGRADSRVCKECVRGRGVRFRVKRRAAA